MNYVLNQGKTLKKNSTRAILLIVATGSLLAVAFQNCSVRRLSDSSASSGSGNLNGAPGGTAPGSTTPTIPGGSNGATCLFNSNNNGSIVGITGYPAVKSSFAQPYKYSSASFNSTSLGLQVSSACYQKTDVNKALPCTPSTSPTPSCTPQTSFSISVFLSCSETSSTATECTRFNAALTNTEINLNDATLGAYINLSVTNVANSCTGAGGRSIYSPAQIPANRVGKIRIKSNPGFTDGGVFSVELIGVEMLKDGTDVANKITVNGTYSGEIVNRPACTP